jgi:hypothetical protein
LSALLYAGQFLVLQARGVGLGRYASRLVPLQSGGPWVGYGAQIK